MRYYPRQDLTRHDALIGSDHVSRHSIRNSRGRRDEAYQYAGMSNPGLTVVTSSYNGSLTAQGSTTITWTISGDDIFHANVATDSTFFSLLVKGLAANSTALASQFADAASGGDFALSNNNQTLTWIPRAATVSAHANQTFFWAFDEQLFRNRAGSVSVSSSFNFLANQ